MGTARAPVVGSGRLPACTARVRKPYRSSPGPAVLLMTSNVPAEGGRSRQRVTEATRCRRHPLERAHRVVADVRDADAGRSVPPGEAGQSFAELAGVGA